MNILPYKVGEATVKIGCTCSLLDPTVLGMRHGYAGVVALLNRLITNNQ